MKKKILIIVILIINFININVKATTIIAVIGQKQIMLASDTRLSLNKNNEEKFYNDSGKKIHKLKNGILVAFAGDTNSIKAIRTGRKIVTKSVETIINDINEMKEVKDLTVAETAEIVAEKYVNLLVDYKGDIIVAGFENNNPVIYGIKAVEGKATWQGIGGQGSFWAIGSGSDKLINTINNNLKFDNENISLIDKFRNMKDKNIEKIIKESLQQVIEDYELNYDLNDRTTGGKVDLVILKNNLINKKA